MNTFYIEFCFGMIFTSIVGLVTVTISSRLRKPKTTAVTDGHTHSIT